MVSKDRIATILIGFKSQYGPLRMPSMKTVFQNARHFPGIQRSVAVNPEINFRRKGACIKLYFERTRP